MSTLPTADLQTPPISEQPQAATTATMAVCLPSLPADQFTAMVARLRSAFPEEVLLIASPDQAEEQGLEGGGVHLVNYPVNRTESEWVLTAADYTAASRLAEQRGVQSVLLLGSECATLHESSLVGLREAVSGGADLAVPRYDVNPQEGLVNSSLLYPLTRALFGVDAHFPLPLDAALSSRMLGRLAAMATRAAGTAEEALVWPVAEAATSGFSVREVDGVERALPRPQESDLTVLLPAVTGSLFADVESKATYWQRARSLPRSRPFSAYPGSTEADPAEIRDLVENFRLAFSNLREIWALVLPPQTLLAIKKLSLTAPEAFSFAPNLWARVVYDFALAFHVRTLNRGHLLGSMTPLYLAWVASLLHSSHNHGERSLLESTATAFEQEKPYLVSRWRWPDRFNP